MPVRSLSSSVLIWPDAAVVDQAVREWAEVIGRQRAEVVRIGYFGSYARGDWGVGSDLDLIVVIENSEEPFERRPARWDVTKLPVPADLLVYTLSEWKSLPRKTRFRQTLDKEVLWVFQRQLPSSA